MERRIRSFDTLTEELRDKLQEQYPDGIENHHIRTVSTPKGENLRVIELRTPEVMYLIKLTAESRQEMDEFLEQDQDSDAGNGDELEGSDDLEGADEEEEEEDNDAPPADDGDDDDED
ncbi:MAG TPA: hypothetical protein PLV70_12450 [Flavobacteriales bacterium]|mgnify:CR=1 FL=1|nr:hypothetical protein [Flavobacteriales bacterium]HRN37819.1 hypothetical protein [Flavobacteriales bacterium]HRO39074.1 hypothetical protein [Flavobacteriales bacterium]HRP81341.1 hypothetical protein [Flavobacteriales bacterium]HRQ85916.1 hypothetical protein [Flavobacteriales bacterium]